MPVPLLYESHSHTPLCKHATGEPVEYAAAAAARGLKGIIFTCHCPLPDGISAGVRMAPGEFDRYAEMVGAARAEFAGRVDVRLGLESDFFPGVESWLELLHARYPLHHVLGSVHMQVPEYRARFFRGDWFDYQQTYFQHLAESAETGLYDTLAHPDLVKNEAPSEWDFTRIRPYIERALDRIATTGVAMELNTSGLQKAIPIRIELGPRDIEKNICIAARRDTLEKTEVALDDTLSVHISEILNTIQQSMFDKALQFRNDNTYEVQSYEEFKKVVEKGFVIAHWDGTAETEAKIKEETKATIRVIPEEADYILQYRMDEPGTCIYSGKPASRKVVFAKAY